MARQSYSQIPFKLKPNRVWRAYKGGLLLDAWQNRSDPHDDETPEEWIASVVPAKNIHPIPNEGLSVVAADDSVGDGSSEPLLLRDLVASDPTSFLGDKHAQKYGANMAVLIKMIDSSCRLVIQTHPDKAFARQHFDSAYGKTESWYILGGRPIDGEAPYVLLGFKPGVTRSRWEAMFYQQDVAGMIDCLHRIPVQPGDAFLIEGGLPHAIGAGCLLLEVQEPTDLTMRLEKVMLDGRRMSDDWCNQGLGFEKMFDCFHYDPLPLAETVARTAIRPVVLRETAGGIETALRLPTQNPLFSLRRIDVTGAFQLLAEPTFSVVVVVAGSGKVAWSGGEAKVSAGDEWFLPAALGETTWQADDVGRLELFRCFPPA